MFNYIFIIQHQHRHHRFWCLLWLWLSAELSVGVLFTQYHSTFSVAEAESLPSAEAALHQEVCVSGTKIRQWDQGSCHPQRPAAGAVLHTMGHAAAAVPQLCHHTCKCVCVCVGGGDLLHMMGNAAAAVPNYVIIPVSVCVVGGGGGICYIWWVMQPLLSPTMSSYL